MFQINWKLKAFLYSVLEILKLKNFLYFLQKYITKRSLPNNREIKKIWLAHSKTIEGHSVKKLIEVGAGKSLDQNFFFSYKFNSKISQTLIDINKMIDFDLVNIANEQVSKLFQLPVKGKVKNISDLKYYFNIDYKAPFALEDFPEDEKFDLCITTNTFEHFKKTELVYFLKILKKILIKNGKISSVIDYSDHYSHTDKNISNLNFLKYSNEEWGKYNNNFLLQYYSVY